MRRWSLRRHKRRAPKADTGSYRLDPGPSDSFPTDGFRSQDLPQATPFSGAPTPVSALPSGYTTQPPTPGAWQPVAGFAPQPGGQDTGGFQPYVDPVATNPTGLAQRPPAKPAGDAWPETMEQFGLHLLTLAEQMRISLDELEADEADPDRLQQLYDVDHAVTRMRRASRDLRTLAGRGDEDISGADTSLLDVIRMAMSAIEHYTQVSVGRVADFAVTGYAADDVACLLAALLDNATRYSPGTVSVSAHLADGGSVLFRVEDTGIGFPMDAVEALNAVLAGDVPPLDAHSGRHTGFPVVHRIARKYAIDVRLAARSGPSTGTIVMITVPPQLLCELPIEPVGKPEPPVSRPPGNAVAVLPSARRESTPTPPKVDRQEGVPEKDAHTPGDAVAPADESVDESVDQAADQAVDQAADQAADEGESVDIGSLPRRESVSLRGTQEKPSRPEATARSPEDDAAARRSFADDLDAFSLGSQTSAGKGSTS